jgi:hypothetical protein
MPNGQVAHSITSGWLDLLKARKHYMGLLIGDPRTTSDPLSLEVLGNAYRRPLITFERRDQVLRNVQPLNWTVGPMTRVAGVASFDAAFNGNWQFWLPLEDPLDYPAGGALTYAKGDLFVGIDT